MAAALNAEDPDGIVVPYCLSAGTDAKWFSKLGIRCFGFSPLQLPPQLDFAGMFHGIDERVPVGRSRVRRPGPGPAPRQRLALKTS